MKQVKSIFKNICARALNTESTGSTDENRMNQYNCTVEMSHKMNQKYIVYISDMRQKYVMTLGQKLLYMYAHHNAIRLTLLL